MIDDCWYDNVSPLVAALHNLNIDPKRWAEQPDEDVFYCERNPKTISIKISRRELGCSIEQIHFAMGYMQAYANLTGMGWHQQICEAMAEAEKQAQEDV